MSRDRMSHLHGSRSEPNLCSNRTLPTQAENEATTAARHTTIKTSKGAYLNLSLTTGHQSIWYKAYLSDRHRGNGVKALHFDSVQYLTDKTTVVTGKTVRTRATGSAVTFRRSGLGQYGGSDKEYFRLRTWVCAPGSARSRARARCTAPGCASTTDPRRPHRKGPEEVGSPDLFRPLPAPQKSPMS